MATLRKRNDKWHVQIRRKDYPSQTKSFTSKKIALKWIREIENKIDGGFIIQKNSTTNVSLRGLIHRYIEEVLPKKKVQANETIILKAFMRQPFVKKPLIQITPRDFSQYRDYRLKAVKSSTLLRELCILQHLYNVANREWNYDIPNPIKSIEKPSISNRRERRLSEDEYTFLIKGNYPQVGLRSIIEIALETAMRRGEILNIHPEHLKGQTLLIPLTKNGHPRTIPLTKKALHILENTELPFPMSANAVRLAWDKLKIKGNIKDLHFHDLRHEAISKLFEKGLSIPEVSLISGHKDVRMLFRYTHLKAEDILRKL